MVDHTFVYTGAVRKIQELIDDGSLGEIYYYDSVAREPGSLPARRQRDLGPGVHDLSIMDYVLAGHARRGVRHGDEPRRRRHREHRVPDPVLRGQP